MTPEEEFELFRGFPLPKIERETLDKLAQAASRKKAIELKSRGTMRSILFNLIGRGWITRTERPVPFAPETYSITHEGECAREMDDAVLASAFKLYGPRGQGGTTAAYKNLQQRLTVIRNSN
jgi:hypothetical protein